MDNQNVPPRRVQVYFAPKPPEEFWAEVILLTGVFLFALTFMVVSFIRNKVL